MTHDKTTDSDEDTETNSEDEVTQTESSTSVRKTKFFGVALDKLSYKRLPKKCLKLSFITINSIMFLAGIITLVLSIWMLVDIKLLIGQRYFISILLLVGIFATVVSFLGLLALVKKRKNMLMVYIVCHMTALCIIFLCAIMSFALFDNVTSKIQNNMMNSIKKYRNLDWATESWDYTQRYLHCCGIKSYKDWYEYRKSIPSSCCSTKIEKCINISEKIIYKNGCLKGAVILLKSHVNSISIATLFISIMIVTSLFIAFGVRRNLKEN